MFQIAAFFLIWLVAVITSHSNLSGSMRKISVILDPEGILLNTGPGKEDLTQSYVQY